MPVIRVVAPPWVQPGALLARHTPGSGRRVALAAPEAHWVVRTPMETMVVLFIVIVVTTLVGGSLIGLLPEPDLPPRGSGPDAEPGRSAAPAVGEAGGGGLGRTAARP